MTATGNSFSDSAASLTAQDGPSRPVATAAALTAELESQIASGRLQPGDRLAPVREAAEALGIAPNTVSRAYRTLRDRGLVFGEGRRGTFVADRPAVVSGTDQPVPDNLVDLAGGNPDPALLPDLGVALGRIATDHVAYGRPPIDLDLAAALRDDLGPDLQQRLKIDLEPGHNLAVVGGALDGIERTLMAQLRPGDRVAVEDPAYSSILNLVSALNLRPVPVAIDDFGPRPDHLERAIASGVSAVIITPRAHNPTGAAMNRARADELAAVIAGQPDVLIIEDDHAGWVSGVRYQSAVPESATRWAIIRSVAKSLGPDLRLAAVAGDTTTIARVTGRQLLGTGWVSHILQRTVAEVLGAGETPALLERASHTYAERRSTFMDRLADGGIQSHGRSGLNVWVPVDDEAAVVAGMQQQGFAIRSGARYRQDAAPAVRVSTASTAPETLVRAADAMVELLTGGAPQRSV